jgi:hypothetical protein
MQYVYHFSYDEEGDEFYAFIDDGTQKGKCIMKIQDTDEICYYIKSGVMNHIDDVDGLEKHLKTTGVFQEGDTLLVSENPIW